jgi:hypothetical protein
MPHAAFILADDTAAWGKFVIFGIIGAIWLISQAVSAANKLTKKTGTRPPPMGSPRRPSGTIQPPPISTIGRPGGPATTLSDARRLAQARLNQARLAAAQRPAPAAPPARVVQQRPAPSVSQVTSPHPSAAQTQAAVVAAHPVVRRTISPLQGAVPSRAGMLPKLTPQSLRSQFILTEILSAPVALRQNENR